MRVCLVGYGLAGKVFHAPLINAVEGLDLAVVVSSDSAKVHADMPAVRVTATLAQALEDASIGAVVLACPDNLHAALAVEALRAGRHVVVDKPMAPTLAEAQTIAREAERAGRMASVFHNRRWDADFLTLKVLVASGALGEIVQFESHFDRFRPAVGTRWKDQRPGGVWLDLGAHLVDQALCLLGMPQAVWAEIAVQRPGGNSPDFAHVVLRYPRLRAILHISQLAPDHRLRFAVHGTGGSWIKHGLDVQEDQSKAGLKPGAPGWGDDPDQGVLTEAGGGAKPVANEPGDYRAFYSAVRAAWAGEGENPVPPEQALAVMQVLEAGLQSARERREVEL